MVNHDLGVICGGSGSSKFVTALNTYLGIGTRSFDPIFVANVADNFWHYGLYICPDVDILTYSLAGLLDEERGWGIKRDTFNFLRLYRLFNREDAWFNLGDADLALSLRRTELIAEGWNISKITRYFCKMFRIRRAVVPATDDNVQTFVKTDNDSMHLQDFWVKKKGKPRVKGVEHRGNKKAKPSQNLLDAVKERVVILPANPISSILPTIKLCGVREKLAKARTVIAISPFVSNKPFSGPAGKFMRALGIEQSSFGVAKLYSDFTRIFLVDSAERGEVIEKIRGLGIDCIRTNIRIKTPRDKKRIVSEIANLL
jgi:LPPG:FO 2-phospho-L-lactate transferase